MKKNHGGSAGLNKTAALFVVAYLDVAILGGTALFVHWIADPDQAQRSQSMASCSADTRSGYKAALKPIAIPDAIGSEQASHCYDDRPEARR